MVLVLWFFKTRACVQIFFLFFVPFFISLTGPEGNKNRHVKVLILFSEGKGNSFPDYSCYLVAVEKRHTLRTAVWDFPDYSLNDYVYGLGFGCGYWKLHPPPPSWVWLDKQESDFSFLLSILFSKAETKQKMLNRKIKKNWLCDRQKSCVLGPEPYNFFYLA